MNKYAVLPEQEQENFALEGPSEDPLSHNGNPDDHQPLQPLQNQQENLTIEKDQVALDVRSPENESRELAEGQIIHEYRDFGFGYRYRRIKKGRFAGDDRIEVDANLFAKDLPLEEMSIWALKVNANIGLIGWLLVAICGLWSFLFLDWSAALINNILTNSIFTGLTVKQRRVYREALINNDFKTGVAELSFLGFLPLMMVLFGFMLTLIVLGNSL